MHRRAMQPIYDTETSAPVKGRAYIGLARRTIVEAIDQELAPLDISHAQWIVIMLLGDGAASTAGRAVPVLISIPAP